MSTRLRYLYRAFRYRFRVDPAEIRFIRQCLRPGQVAVDIGCHKGAYAYWMRRSVGPTGIVYAFEPQPRQVAYLRDVFSAMQYDNVVLAPLAVSNRCGQMPLYMPHESTHFASLQQRLQERTAKGEQRGAASNSRHSAPCSTLSVDVTTLDDFFADSKRKTEMNSASDSGPHFLKIDVEGHELAVLEGARRTLELHHPMILVECEVRHRPDRDVHPVFEFLESFGYMGSFFCNGRRLPLAEFDPAVHQQLDPTSDHLPSGYANNFVFSFDGSDG
ncbi:MAG TPA: FkbM family methyltransferase [Lacipirellulaceae bacterium]|nr:FkbM family methyltransferase [Lacipirellulaceae bacterium]